MENIKKMEERSSTITNELISNFKIEVIQKTGKTKVNQQNDEIPIDSLEIIGYEVLLCFEEEVVGGIEIDIAAGGGSCEERSPLPAIILSI